MQILHLCSFFSFVKEILLTSESVSETPRCILLHYKKEQAFLLLATGTLVLLCLFQPI